MKPIVVYFIIGAVIILLIGIGLVWKEAQAPGETAEQAPEEEPAGISEQEKSQIEAWIETNDLNQYGDPQDIMYAGGTPLFDERTGQRIDRYDYILRRHPARPWLK